jgi:hypothetical protein
MIATVQEFEESIAFELYVLETIRPAIEQHGGASIDLRGSKTVAAVSVTFSESVSADAVGRLKDQLAPLLFGAAWKVLDLLLEFALNRDGLAPARREWTIAEKQVHALNGSGDSSVLGCSKSAWAAILRVYACTVEHRHCLVHRTVKVDATSGTLEGEDKNEQPLKPLTRDQQVALAKVAGLVARAVAEDGIDRRSEDHLKYELDQLAAHSGLPAFGVGGTSAPVDILLTLIQENGIFILDMTGVLERARKTFPTVAHFNLLVDVPDGSRRRLFAYAEKCPLGKSTIDLKTLPPWLQYR